MMRASKHGPLLAVPAVAWALAAWTRGDAADTLLHTSWLLVIAAPLAGVARVSNHRAGATGWPVIASLTASVGMAVLASALVTLLSTGGSSLGFVARSHAVMAAVSLALAAFGALMATAFDDELDAAALSLAVSLLAGGGVLFAGAWAGAAPRAVVDTLLAANPFVAMASAANIDVLRLDLFYIISPLAHLGVDYPAWYLTGAGYAAVATLCCSGVWLGHREQRPVTAV